MFLISSLNVYSWIWDSTYFLSWYLSIYYCSNGMSHYLSSQTILVGSSFDFVGYVVLQSFLGGFYYWFLCRCTISDWIMLLIRSVTVSIVYYSLRYWVCLHIITNYVIVFLKCYIGIMMAVVSFKDWDFGLNSCIIKKPLHSLTYEER